MIIGVPKETITDKYRVGLLPVGAQLLAGDGHTVLVKLEAGLGSGASDEQYSAAGAQIAATAEEIYATAELIIKVKEPQPHEMALLREGQTVFASLGVDAFAALDAGRTASLNIRNHRLVNEAVRAVYPDLPGV